MAQLTGEENKFQKRIRRRLHLGGGGERVHPLQPPPHSTPGEMILLRAEAHDGFLLREKKIISRPQAEQIKMENSKRYETSSL